jgi:hypothetical protein
MVDGGNNTRKPFGSDQPCTELGMALTPKDPKAASSPLLNERGDSRGWCPWASGIIAREWQNLFQVISGFRVSDVSSASGDKCFR